jgi:hypothetical protein
MRMCRFRRGRLWGWLLRGLARTRAGLALEAASRRPRRLRELAALPTQGRDQRRSRAVRIRLYEPALRYATQAGVVRARPKVEEVGIVLSAFLRPESWHDLGRPRRE